MLSALPPSTPSARRGVTRKRRAGFSMLELVVVMAMLTVAVGLFSSTLISTARHSRMKREMAIASEGARQALEWMRSQPASTLFASFNDSPADDPGGVGSAPGSNFQVSGLTPRTGDADGRAGKILFPCIGNSLREDVVDVPLGMPRDLNGDAAVDAVGHNGDYLLLPVHVRIEWKGVGGDAAFDLYNQYVKQ